MAQHQQVATLPSDNFTPLQLPRRVQPHIFLWREEGGDLLVPAFPLEVVTLPQGGTTDRGGSIVYTFFWEFIDRWEING